MNKVILNYDKDADILYISFDEPKPAASEEIDGVLIRKDLKSKEIVGLTILDLKARIK